MDKTKYKGELSFTLFILTINDIMYILLII